jgi:hypothetical protein
MLERATTAALGASHPAPAIAPFTSRRSRRANGVRFNDVRSNDVRSNRLIDRRQSRERHA